MRAIADAASGLGWLVLVFVLAAFPVNHVVGFFAFAQSDTDQVMVVGLAALSMLGIAVVLAAHRRGVRWTWAATWIPIAAFALIVPYIDDSSIGAFYLGAALVLAAAQAATWPRTRSVAPSELPAAVRP